MPGPATYELHLLQCFGRVEVIATLGNASPPRRQLIQRLFTGLPLSDEVAAHRRTCPSNTTPAVQINFAAISQAIFERIENGVHLFGGGQAEITDRETQVS